MNTDEKLINNLFQEIKRGSLVMAVLINLNKPAYGYSLVTDLQASGIEIEQNTLYPLLRRLESQNLVESSWDTTESRPRKYYSITEMGTEILEILIKEWRTMNETLENMIMTEENK